MKIFVYIRKIFIFTLLAFILLLSVGFFYEKVSEFADSKRYPAPGKILDINGHKMHIYAEGTGDTTVVFASGFGIPCPYADYYPLYSKISKHARVAVYDRSGYGWSESSSTSKDIDTISKEIHELLDRSGEKPPYILVAHSLGSLEVIRFAQLYPTEVKGIVTIDAGNPEFYANETINDGALSSLKLKQMLNNLGIFRLLFNHSTSFYTAAYSERNQLALVPKELREIDKVLYLKNMVNKSKINEYNNIQTNAKTVINGGKLDSIPLIILTSQSEAKDIKWKNSQETFKKWSSTSMQAVIEGTNHNMHQFVPDKINQKILSLIEK